MPQQPQQKSKFFTFGISDDDEKLQNEGQQERKNIYEMICDIEKACKFIDNFVNQIEKF